MYILVISGVYCLSTCFDLFLTICIYVCVCVCVCVCVYMYVCVFVCMYVCMYVYNHDTLLLHCILLSADYIHLTCGWPIYTCTTCTYVISVVTQFVNIADKYAGVTSASQLKVLCFIYILYLYIYLKGSIVFGSYINSHAPKIDFVSSVTVPLLKHKSWKATHETK